MSAKPLVLVVGPTGRTGLPIVNALIESGDFRVAGIVRTTSVDKSEVKDLEHRGVQIHAIDWITAPSEELAEIFQGVDVLISACNYEGITKQNKLIDAAIAVGSVKRFIPCDWATSSPPGAMGLADIKRRIVAHAEAVGLPYTVVDVGFWYEFTFPPNVKVIPDDFDWIQKLFCSFYHDGKAKSAVVDRSHLGRFIPSILKDERTVGRKVFANDDEITQEQVWEWADKYSGRKLSNKRTSVTIEEVRQALQERPDDKDWERIGWEYMNSIYIRGDNSIEEARKNGYLIARELYPDVPVQSAEEWAKEYYTQVRV